jgi:predicted AlkP superfamily pyrophosphatase or phosphodiesterase
MPVKSNRLVMRLAIVGLAIVVFPVMPAAQPGSRHVVMISIDGLKPATYTRPGPSKIPTLRKLAQDGVHAEGVVGVLPTVTYPSHTTMITGVPPAIHGIYNNRILDPDDTSNGAWYWYARDVKVPTLYSVVKGLGLSTAAVSWPVTVDAEIDYLVPEFTGVTQHPQWLNLLRALARPRLLLDRFEAAVRPIAWPPSDTDRTELAAWIIRTYRPHLMLLHIFDTDSAEHEYGPDTPQALAAIEKADAHVNRIVEAITEAGLRDRTDIVIVSDHGFLGIEQQLQLNFAFKQSGLIEVNEAGRLLRWDAYFYAAGGSGFVLLRNPGDMAVRDRVAALLKEISADPGNGVLAVWNQDDLRRRGADPRASFGVDMRDGFYTAGGHDVLVRKAVARGGHGFAPDRAALHAALIMSGPDVGARGNLGVVRMTQIGPTVASWFGGSLSPNADMPLALQPAAQSGAVLGAAQIR